METQTRRRTIDLGRTSDLERAGVSALVSRKIDDLRVKGEYARDFGILINSSIWVYDGKIVTMRPPLVDGYFSYGINTVRDFLKDFKTPIEEIPGVMDCGWEDRFATFYYGAIYHETERDKERIAGSMLNKLKSTRDISGILATGRNSLEIKESTLIKNGFRATGLFGVECNERCKTEESPIYIWTKSGKY